MMRFSDKMLEAIGTAIKVPEAIADYLDWIDTQGLARSYQTGQVYALIDPALENSCLGLVPPDPGHASAWVGAECADRLAPFCQTGGDGSYAALWVDDDGATRIVHLGSGSGSTMIGVMVDDPVDFLRLLALGYEELCWPQNHALTPAQIHDEEWPEEDYEGMEDERPAPPPIPVSLRNWVTSTFSVTIPERASEIIGEMADLDGSSEAIDPFARWLREVQVR